MASITPVWTDSIASPVISPQVLALGSRVRGTLNLAGKNGARLFLAIGRSGITALTNGVNVEVRRLVGGRTTPAGIGFLSDYAACILKQGNNTSGYATGSQTFVIDGT